MEKNKNEFTAKRSVDLRIARERNVKKLTKLLSSVVKMEWEIITSAHKLDDNVSKISAGSVASAASSIQGAISHLISTETESVSLTPKEKQDITSAEVSTLKRTIKNNKLLS